MLGSNQTFLLALGAICGTFVGGLLLGLVTASVLLPDLAANLVISAGKAWRHT